MVETIFSALKEIFKFLTALFVTPKDQIRKVVLIFDTMNRILGESKVQRVLVLRAHNGGGIIKPSGDLYVSAIYDDYREPFEATKQDFQKLEADMQYAKTLLDVIQNGKVRYSIDNMPDGILKRVWKSIGVTHGLIYYLGQDNKNIYLCTCTTSYTGLWLTGEEETELDILVNIIKQNIK